MEVSFCIGSYQYCFLLYKRKDENVPSLIGNELLKEYNLCEDEFHLIPLFEEYQYNREYIWVDSVNEIIFSTDLIILKGRDYDFNIKNNLLDAIWLYTIDCCKYYEYIKLISANTQLIIYSIEERIYIRDKRNSFRNYKNIWQINSDIFLGEGQHYRRQNSDNFGFEYSNEIISKFGRKAYLDNNGIDDDFSFKGKAFVSKSLVVVQNSPSSNNDCNNFLVKIYTNDLTPIIYFYSPNQYLEREELTYKPNNYFLNGINFINYRYTESKISNMKDRILYVKKLLPIIFINMDTICWFNQNGIISTDEIDLDFRLNEIISRLEDNTYKVIVNDKN